MVSSALSSTLSAYRAALSDPSFPRAKTLGFSLGAAALTLIEPRRLSPRARTAYRAAMSTFAGLAVTDSLRAEPLPVDRGTVGAVATGATAALMPLSEKCDAFVIDRANRLLGGATRPLLAAVTAVAMVDAMVRQHQDEMTMPELGEGASWFAHAPRSGGVFDPTADPEIPEATERDLTPKERAVLEALCSKDFPGAEAIRSQLRTARALDWGEAMIGESVLDLTVKDPEQLIVPHFQTWPVGGFFEVDGHGFSAELGVMDGLISTLYLSPVAEDDEQIIRGADLLGGRSFEEALPSASDLKPTLESARPAR